MQTLSLPQGMEEYQKSFQTASASSSDSAILTTGDARCQTYVWKTGLDGLKQAVWR